ncbi:DNA repair protein rad50 [Mucor velutinosus]|uniref:DNA repair protein rad50 n=1 Tax=Mucor velutinosus TaxID=708070 RepID=A0AAN7I450_9FUNG|nr:DNA repair protein rad50 [Mucor velutinosus]
MATDSVTLMAVSSSGPSSFISPAAENKAAHINFEIEITVSGQESIELSFTTQIIKLCHADQEDASYMNISLGSDKIPACSRT